LPQEKVGNFSGIDSKQLLFETEKTLSDDKDLYHTHKRLITMEKQHKESDRLEGTFRSDVKSLSDEERRQKGTVDRMEERKIAQEQAELLRKKILWLKLDSIRASCLELKNAKEQAKQEVVELENALTPLLEAKKVSRQRLLQAETEVNAFEREIKTHEKNMEKQKHKYNRHDDQIEETLAELATIDNTRVKYESDAQALRGKVETLQDLLDQQTPMEELEATFAAARRDQESIQPKYQDTKKNLQQFQRDMSSVHDEFSVAQKKLDRLQNEKEQRRAHVLRQFNDVKKAYEWIQNNRNLFRKEVVGPIACEISPKSNNSAAYLEQHVPNALLKSFVVQDKSDYDLLYGKVRRDQNIPINIIMVDRISQQASRIFSEQKMAMLKQDHGVVGYLDESFEGPDIVVEALKSNCAIHKVLVGGDRTQDSIDDRGLGQILSESETDRNRLQSYCIFASKGGKSFKYTSQVSRYSGKPSLRVDDIKPSRILSRGASDDAKQKVIQQLQEIESRKTEIQPKIDETAREENELLVQVQNAQQRCKDAKKKIQMIRKSIQKLENTKRKLRQAEEKLKTDDEEEKKQLVEKLKQCLAYSLKAMNAHSECNKKMVELTVKASGVKVDKEFAVVQARVSEEQAEEAEFRMHEIRQKFRALKQQFAHERNRFKEMTLHAAREAPLEDENGVKTDLHEKLTVQLAQFDTIDLAQTALAEAEATMNGIEEDRGALERYQKVLQALEQAKQNLDDLLNRKEKGRSELEQMKAPWLATLQETISTVDKRFTEYMRDLGCVGSVSLKDGDKEENFTFEDYAVEIKVSFRDGVKPSVLSSRVQSGGERSVSTIMYLMAMQDMMVAPFRCVDEINQGLDDRNERLVFRRIVENSTQPPGPNGPTDHCGQYWLITPKLLPNLNDMEVAAINVVCIFNGPFNLEKPTDWCAKELIGIANRKRRHNRIGADDEGESNKVSRTGE